MDGAGRAVAVDMKSQEESNGSEVGDCKVAGKLLFESVHNSTISSTNSHVVDMNNDNDKRVTGAADADTVVGMKTGEAENSDQNMIELGIPGTASLLETVESFEKAGYMSRVVVKTGGLLYIDLFFEF